MLTLDKFEEASEKVKEVTTETKLVYSDYFSQQTGNKVYLKPENMQFTGAYKVRGAYYKISTLTEEERAKGLITASAGNHAQGVAYAAKCYGCKAVIVMPTTTPLIKVNRTKSYGAEVVLYGDVYDEACQKAYELAEKEGYTFIHPFDDLAVATGQGTMVMYSMDSFYNSETGECKFDSEDFISLLELCNTFPKEYDYNSGESESTASLLRSGKVLLTSVNMSSFSDMQMFPALYGEPVNFIGFPTNSGSGSVVGFNNRFCVAAKSKNKDGAWAFIRSFLLPDNQNKLDWNLPVNKAAFEQKIADAMKKQDDNDSVVSTWWYDDVEITIGPLTEEDAQVVRDMVYNATTEATYDEQLMNIITEEAEYYFNGEKSAQEIAGIIQSRAQLYIDENR